MHTILINIEISRNKKNNMSICVSVSLCSNWDRSLGDECGSVLYSFQNLIQIEVDSKSTRKVDLGHLLLCKNADSFPHHIRECIKVNVLIVTKQIRLCANGPFWTLL